MYNCTCDHTVSCCFVSGLSPGDDGQGALSNWTLGPPMDQKTILHKQEDFHFLCQVLFSSVKENQSDVTFKYCRPQQSVGRRLCGRGGRGGDKYPKS